MTKNDEQLMQNCERKKREKRNGQELLVTCSTFCQKKLDFIIIKHDTFK